MKATVLRPIVAWALLACAGLAGANTAPVVSKPPEAASRMSHYSATFTVADDGSSVEERAWSLAVLNAADAVQHAQTVLSYSPSIQSGEVLTAYTLKRDGRRLEVPKSSYKVGSSGTKDPSDAAALDSTMVTVVFPKVEVGDTVVFAYRVKNKVAIFPRHFSINERFPVNEIFDDVKIKIDAPIALWGRYQVQAFQEVQKADTAGRRVMEWAWQNKVPQETQRKNFSVYDDAKEPGFAFSSFTLHADIAKAYGERARPQALVSARVKVLADKITAGKRTPRDEVRALYEWVALNIGTVGGGLQLGVVVPRELDFVLDKKQGDAKDHATLLQALLSAKGIRSTQALLNAGSIYGVTAVPVVSGLNHVINYVPSLNLFLDASSPNTPFGMLPFADEDKPVYLVDGHRDGLKTPIQPIGSNQQTMTTTVRLFEDGSAKGRVQVHLTGMYAVNSRIKMRNISVDQEPSLVPTYFSNGGFDGKGSFTKDDTTVLRDTFGYAAQFEVKGMFPKRGPGSFTVQPLFYSESPVADYLEQATQPVEEDAPVTCASGRSIERYTYELPARMTVVSLPKNVSLKSEFLSYRSTYQLKGHRLTVERVFDDRSKGNVCSPAVLKAYQKFAQQAEPDANAKVVIK